MCGALFLVSEILKRRPALWSMIQHPEEQEEHFVDADSREVPSDGPSDDDDDDDGEEEEDDEDREGAYDEDDDDEQGSDLELDAALTLDTKKRQQKNAMNQAPKAASKSTDPHRRPEGQSDPTKRDPKFANTEGSCLWELVCWRQRDKERQRETKREREREREQGILIDLVHEAAVRQTYPSVGESLCTNATCRASDRIRRRSAQ